MKNIEMSLMGHRRNPPINIFSGIGGRGTPLKIKSNLKYNNGLTQEFEINSINYCFLSTLKTGIFLSRDVLEEVTNKI